MMQIYNVFHVSKLEKVNQPVKGQQLPEQGPIIVDSVVEYEVKGIIDSEIEDNGFEYTSSGKATKKQWRNHWQTCEI